MMNNSSDPGTSRNPWCGAETCLELSLHFSSKWDSEFLGPRQFAWRATCFEREGISTLERTPYFVLCSTVCICNPANCRSLGTWRALAGSLREKERKKITVGALQWPLTALRKTCCCAGLTSTVRYKFLRRIFSSHIRPWSWWIGKAIIITRISTCVEVCRGVVPEMLQYSVGKERTGSCFGLVWTLLCLIVYFEVLMVIVSSSMLVIITIIISR